MESIRKYRKMKQAFQSWRRKNWRFRVSIPVMGNMTGFLTVIQFM